MNKKISPFSKVLLLLAAISLVISIFVPIWRIELDAPQYPEGLVLQIFADSLGGDVQIINGLNHYIGMKTLHEDDFIEFTVLPYIIGAFALASLVAIFISRKKFLYLLFSAFVLFGVIAMVDFYRWEYDYGHNLDPHAAIIVPGMAYQPPLIGFKQLLNFGAYSIPDTGGWLFIASGIFMLLAVILEVRKNKKIRSKKVVSNGMLLFILALSSCSPASPEPVKINVDQCDHCKMKISTLQFAGELVTDKGRIYKFDDVICMLGFMDSRELKYSFIMLYDYASPGELHDATKMYFVSSPDIRSPMGGNYAAFVNGDIANDYAGKMNTAVVGWNNLVK